MRKAFYILPLGALLLLAFALHRWHSNKYDSAKQLGFSAPQNSHAGSDSQQADAKVKNVSKSSNHAHKVATYIAVLNSSTGGKENTLLGNEGNYSHERILEKMEGDRSNAIVSASKDIQMGLNAEIYEKVSQMHSNTAFLVQGIMTNQVRDVFGIPYAVRIQHDMEAELTLQALAAENPNTANQSSREVLKGITYWYSPADGWFFDGRNGKGYFELFIHFDQQGKLDQWQWEKDLYVMSFALSGWTRRAGVGIHPYREEWEKHPPIIPTPKAVE